MNKIKCGICGSADFKIIYSGPIRFGKPGNYTDKDFNVQQCLACDSAFIETDKINYEDESYRTLINGSSDPLVYRQLHDKEVKDKHSIFNIDLYREKTVLDIGAGAGSFLDSLLGIASRTIAVEPNGIFSNYMSERHITYPYSHVALENEKEKVDIVTSFAVIEHLDDPLSVLKDANKLLTPGGKIILSTPNHDDLLLELLPEYRSFFYRIVHKWYFNRKSLKNILEKSGFSNIQFVYQQRYDLSNMLVWLKEKRPSGSGAVPFFSRLDDTYRENMVKSGRAENIFVTAEKK